MAGNAENFADRLVSAVLEKRSQVCVGLDPRLELLPAALVDRHRQQMRENPGRGCGRREVAVLYEEFCAGIIEAVSPFVIAAKLQLACFEQYGPPGIRTFKHLCRQAADAGLIVIADAKRGDIGISAEAYSAAFIGRSAGLAGEIEGFGVDAVTVNPFFGSDGVQPFLDDSSRFGRGIFILARTSNPGAADLQDYPEPASGQNLSRRIATLVSEWGSALIGSEGYSSIGAVVGATQTGVIADLRGLMPKAFLLLPGYGAQGAGAADVAAAFDDRGLGALVAASRSIIYAGDGEDYRGPAAEAARQMRDSVWQASRGKNNS